MLHINIRSLPANFAKLQTLISSLHIKPPIISINETWLQQNQQGEFNSFSDYTFISNCKKEHKGGVVALYIKNNFSFCIRDDMTVMKDKLIESLFIDVHLNKKETVTIGTIYRSPCNDSKTSADFLANLKPILQAITNSKLQTFILGDLNFNLLDYDDSNIYTFVDTMYEKWLLLSYF